MSKIYRVWLHRGVRAKTELGLFMSREVANHVAANTVLKEDQTVDVEEVEIDDNGNIAQYEADQHLARIRSVLTPEELELLKARQGLV